MKTLSALDYALRYAKEGIRVIWIPKGKKAPFAVNDWPNVATTDAKKINQWAGEHPGCNFGLVMDELVAVDIDDPARAAAFLDEHQFPETRTHLTGSGGFHLIYRAPKNCPPLGNSTNIGGLKIDIRHKNGQIVCPGSVHPTGTIYKLVNEAPIAQLTETHIAVLRSGGGDATHDDKAWRDMPLKEMIDGCGRKKRLLSERGKLIRNGARGEPLMVALQDINVQFKEPLSEAELERIFRANVRQKSVMAPVVPTMTIRRFDTMTKKVVEWLWHNHIARGMLNAVVGDPGEGKSTIVTYIAARGSVGKTPEGAHCEPFNTMYIGYEQPHEYTTLPSFEAMGGDQSRMFEVRGVTADYLEMLEKEIVVRNISLLIIDPLYTFLGDVDYHRANETQGPLERLATMAENTRCAVVGLSHGAKASGDRAIHSMLGSVAIAGAMRMILMAGSNKDKTQRAILVVKHSVAPWTKALGFRFLEKKKPEDGLAIELTGPSELTYADAVASEKNVVKKSLTARAEDYIRGQLRDGPRRMREIVPEGDACELVTGFKERLLQNAAASLRVVKTREGRRGVVVWSLPPPPKFTVAGAAMRREAQKVNGKAQSIHGP